MVGATEMAGKFGVLVRLEGDERRGRYGYVFFWTEEVSSGVECCESSHVCMRQIEGLN